MPSRSPPRPIRNLDGNSPTVSFAGNQLAENGWRFVYLENIFGDLATVPVEDAKWVVDPLVHSVDDGAAHDRKAVNVAPIE